MLVIPFFIPHRGCPHRCLFCDQQAISGAVETEPDETQLRDTIERWLGFAESRHPVQLAFYGGSFSCLDESLQQRLFAAARPYLETGVLESIRISTRPDCLSQEICSFLYDSGVRTVELGVQSMNDEVLRRACRGHSVVDSRDGLRLLQRAGFTTGVQLMVGLPGESTGSFLGGVAEVIRLRPDFVRLYPALVLKSTGLARLVRANDWRPLSLNRAITLTRLARQRFTDAGIRVIRMGLQPSDGLAENLVDGPYHPAFGELVMSRTWYLRLRRLFSQAVPGQTVELTISERDYSALVGRRRGNLARLERIMPGRRLVIRTDSMISREQFNYVIC